MTRCGTPCWTGKVAHLLLRSVFFFALCSSFQADLEPRATRASAGGDSRAKVQREGGRVQLRDRDVGGADL